MKLKHLFCLLFFCSLLCSCEQILNLQKKKWQVTLKRDDKTPYGTYLAYHSLPYYFPKAQTEALSGGFRYTDMDNEMKQHDGGISLLILEGLDFYVSEEEWDQLLLFAKNGNEVMIFCSRLDEKIASQLGCYKHGGLEEYPPGIFAGGSNEHALTLAGDNRTYGYSGRSLQGFFSSSSDFNTKKTRLDKQIIRRHSYFYNDTTLIRISPPDTLGYTQRMDTALIKSADLLRYKVGDGHITIHGAPLVLSNYFLLQQDNIHYLDGIWSTLPEGIDHIYWNSYYKRSASGSSMSVLWQFPAIRWAIIIAIITLLLYVLFEGKRRQRIIPIIKPVENTSVSFAETVGRLYYNKKNNANLAEKMIQHFLEWVRNHYYINTNHLNDEFVHALTIKSGMPESTVKHLVDSIHELRLGNAYADEAYLYNLYTTIELFYKNNRQWK